MAKVIRRLFSLFLLGGAGYAAYTAVQQRRGLATSSDSTDTADAPVHGEALLEKMAAGAGVDSEPGSDDDSEGADTGGATAGLGGGLDLGDVEPREPAPVDSEEAGGAIEGLAGGVDLEPEPGQG